MITIIVGEMGSGKTTMLKERFLSKSKREKLAYALIKKDLGEFPYEKNFKEFVNVASTKANMLFIIDEARTAIPREEPRPDKKEWDFKLISWLLNSRKCNNQIFVVFHTLREIPLWFIGYSNYMLRFNTKDRIELQLTRFQTFPNVTDSLTNYPTIKRFEYDEIRIQ